MEQTNEVITISWDLFFWTLGVAGTILVVLLTILGFFYRATNKSIHIRMDKTDERMNKTDEYMKDMQRQVRDNSEETKLALMAIKMQQENEMKRLDTVQSVSNSTISDTLKMANSLISQLQFMSSYDDSMQPEIAQQSKANKRNRR